MVPLYVTVAAATIVVMVVLVIVLGRHIARLAETLAGFRDEIQPLVEEIQRDADRTRERLEALQRRQAAGA